jgi:hypothetical protein
MASLDGLEASATIIVSGMQLSQLVDHVPGHLPRLHTRGSVRYFIAVTLVVTRQPIC